MYCSEENHEHNRLEYFCKSETCRKCICQKCVTLPEMHKEHDYTSIEKATGEAKAALMEQAEQVKKAVTSCHAVLTSSQHKLGETQKELDVARREVHESVEAAIRKLRDHEAEVMAEIDEVQNKQNTSHRVLQNDLELKIGQLTSYVEHVQAVVKRNLRTEILRSQSTTAQRGQELLNRNQKQKRQHQESSTVYYETYDKKDISIAFGKLVITNCEVDPRHCTVEIENYVRGIQLRILTRNRMGELCFCPEESLRVKMEDNEGRQINVNIVYNEKENGNNIVHYKPVKKGQYRITTTFQGQNIDEKTLNITSELELVKTFGCYGKGRGRFNCPCGITVNEQQCILIADTDNHRVQVFNINGDYQRELGGYGNKEEKMNFSADVTVDKLNNIIVGDRDNNRVLVLSQDGVFIRSIGEGRVQRPCAVCVSREGNILVCSRKKKRGIKVFSIEGVFITEFRNQRQYSDPFYIAYTNGNYFVTYPEEHCIRVYDENGEFVRLFGSHGRRDGQFDGPYGIAVYEHNYLLVCDRNNNRIQILTLQGKYVDEFGGEGRDIGEMRCPRSLTVLPDGRTVMVLEWGNHSVQVWR